MCFSRSVSTVFFIFFSQIPHSLPDTSPFHHFPSNFLYFLAFSAHFLSIFSPSSVTLRSIYYFFWQLLFMHIVWNDDYFSNFFVEIFSYVVDYLITLDMSRNYILGFFLPFYNLVPISTTIPSFFLSILP